LLGWIASAYVLFTVVEKRLRGGTLPVGLGRAGHVPSGSAGGARTYHGAVDQAGHAAVDAQL
jgi:hypothetical protein